MSERIPNSSEVTQAQRRIEKYTMCTPIIESSLLNEQFNCRLIFKAEVLQPTGSFKVRGAFNKILQIDSRRLRRGVVAWSAGNHGQAVAYACSLMGAKATIFAPNDASKLKLDRMSAYGAEVQLYDRKSQDREELGEAFARKTGAIIIPPYDDEEIICGQGTVLLEATQQTSSLGIQPDAVIVSVGGGGLAAGCGLAINEIGREFDLFTAEPKDYDDTRRSLLAGARQKIRFGAPTICDALVTETPGEISFEIMKNTIRDSFSIADAYTKQAIRLCFEYLRLVVEPGGAIGLGAILENPSRFEGRCVLIPLSGGNVDTQLITRWISRGENPTFLS